MSQTPESGDQTGNGPEKMVRLTTPSHFGLILTNTFQFKPVNPSENFQNIYSKTDKDPFTLLLETRKEKDKARCDAWKDEVQNLLIFVSLVLNMSRLKANIKIFEGRSVLSSRHCFHYRVLQGTQARLGRRRQHCFAPYPCPT